MQLNSPLQRCLLLLPGYELDEFPRSLPSDEAEQLLAGWVALWHPSLLAAMQTIPHWQQAESCPAELDGSLIIVPSVAKPLMHSGYGAPDEDVPSTEDDSPPLGHLLLEPAGSWRQLQQTVLQAANCGASTDLTDDQLADFAALGYAYLQIQLMTRQLRYTSNLDQLLFAEQATAAAEAALSGQPEQAAVQLQACFDTLGQERDHYYSLDVSLLDITLLASTTVGKSLSEQLDNQNHPTSLLASAEVLRRAQDKSDRTLPRIRDLLQADMVSLVGGLDVERPHPVLPQDTFVRDLERGRAAYEALQLPPPSVFSRLEFGMTPDHASDLRRFGYDGALLIAWMAGSYPDGSQAKMSWEASDGTSIQAIACSVLDAADPASFLSLGWLVGEALDNQHVPTVLLAHWPNRYCDYFELLCRIAQRTPALGRLTHATKYFAETDDPYHQERLSAGAFKYTWLAQAEEPSALITAVRAAHQLQARYRSLRNLCAAAWLLENYQAADESAQVAPVESEELDPQDTEPSPADPVATPEKPAAYTALPVEKLAPELEELERAIDTMPDRPSEASEKLHAALQLVDQLSAITLDRLAKSIVGSGVRNASQPDTKETGQLLLNPRSAPQRIRVVSKVEQHFEPADWNFATGRVGYDRYSCIDLPPLGFVVAPFSTQPLDAQKQRALADGGGVVQNEFLEAQIDMHRGHLRSLHVPAKRGNRLSVKIARRERNAKGSFSYSEMVAQDVKMLTSSNICGLVRAVGRLELEGKMVGKFEIDYETWRGSRILEIAIRLTDLQPLDGDNLWKSAYVICLAWPTEAAILRAFPGYKRTTWSSGQAVSPTLLEIDEVEYRTHYLPAGLAFHRRTDSRILETVLPLNSNSVEHRIGIGVDLPQPMITADDFLDRRYALPITATKPLPATQGWLLTADVKSVMVDIDSPLVDATGTTMGVRLALSECAGRSVTTHVRMLHEIRSAARVHTPGMATAQLAVKGDAFTISLRANERTQVDVLWR